MGAGRLPWTSSQGPRHQPLQALGEGARIGGRVAFGYAGLVKQQECAVASTVVIVPELTSLGNASMTGVPLQYRLGPFRRATGRGQHLFQLQVHGVLARNNADGAAG